MSLGSLGELLVVDNEVRELVSEVKSIFENENYKTEKFEPINYKIQIVNGTNFFVKINTDNQYVHLRIYKSLSGEINYSGAKLDKKLEDEITYF